MQMYFTHSCDIATIMLKVRSHNPLGITAVQLYQNCVLNKNRTRYEYKGILIMLIQGVGVYSGQAY